MKLVNMELPKEREGKSDGCHCCAPCSCGDGTKPRYPWGLQVHLEQDQLEALGLSSMPQVGSVLSLAATAKVTRCEESEKEDGAPSRTLSLQIVALGIAAEGRKGMDMEEAGKTLYGGGKE